MTILLHHVRKDLGFVRLPLAAWLAVLLVSTAARALRADLLVADDFVAQRWAALDGLAHYVLAVGAWFLAARIVHSDPPEGSTAFWVTRPVRPASLVLAKLASILLLLAVLPAACEGIVCLANGIRGGVLLQITLEATLLQAVFVAVFALLGALTTDATRLVIAALVASITWAIVPALLRLKQYEPWSGVTAALYSGALAAAVLLVAACTAVVWHQYLTRETRRSALAATLGVALAVAVFVARPVNLLGEPAAYRTAPAPPGLVVSIGGVRLRPASHLGTSLMGTVGTAGAAEGTAVVPFAYRGRIQFPDGATQRFGQSDFWLVSGMQNIMSGSAARPLNVAAAARLGARWDQGPIAPNVMMDVAELAPGLARRYRGTYADYEADFTCRVFRASDVAATPLRAGSVVRLGGIQNVVKRVERSGRVILQVRGSRASTLLPREWPIVAYGLLDRTRNEVVFGTFHELQGWSALGGPGVQVGPATIDFQEWPGGAPGPAEGWLDSAELVMVAFHPVGTITKTVHIPDFAIPDDRR